MAVRNKPTDLLNHLFEALERLNDDELYHDQLERELSKAKAIKEVSDTVIDLYKVQVEGMKIMEKAGYDVGKIIKDNGLPLLLPGRDKDEL